MAKIFLGGGRLREERERLNHSQRTFADAARVTENSIANWENGRASPSATALVAFADAGADVLYILTGRRESAEPELTDRERLAAAIRAVERSLVDLDREFEPAAKAELILAAYDIFVAAGPKKVEEDKVIRLIRAA